MVMGIQEESADTVCGRKRATDQMLKESFKKMGSGWIWASCFNTGLTLIQ